MGAIGPPGKRVFYFQARQEDQLVSLKLEKEQVLFLAGGLSEVMADLATPAKIPDESDLELNYTSICDPRLNATQSLDLAFHVAEYLQRYSTPMGDRSL